MLRKLASYVGEYKKSTILTPVFVAIEVLMECLIPFFTARIIDRGISPGNMPEVWKYGGLLLAMALVSLLFGILAGRSSAVAAAGFAKNIRHAMFYKVQEFSFHNIDRFSTGGIVTRLTTDVSNIQNAFMMIIRIASRSPIMLVFSYCMAFSINKRLSLVFLIVVPILAVGLILIASHAHPIFKRVFELYDKLNIVVQENLKGIRVVKAFVREEHEKEKFNDVSERIYRQFIKAEKLIVLNMPLMQLSAYACMIMVAWFGARIIVNGTL